MRSLLTITAALVALLALAGCKSDSAPAEVPTTDTPPATAAGAPAAGQLPKGVEAKDVPGVGAPPPAGSPQAMQGGAPAAGANGGAPTQ